MSREVRMLRLLLLTTGVLVVVHLWLGDIGGVVEDIVLAMVLGQYYRYRSDIEYFVEAIGPLTSDGS